MKTPAKIINELRERNIHVRQYFDGRRFELFVDGEFHSWWRSPLDAEHAIRRVLEISNEDGIAVEREIAKRLDAS